METALNDFEVFLNREPSPNSLPELVKMALIHYQFETIHPFRDGNGRIGRLLIPLLMIAKGRIDGPILYLSGYLERNRESYMDYMLRVSQTGDWISWIDFFLRGVGECSIEANSQALTLLDLRVKYHRTFQRAGSSARLIRLIDQLFLSPSITFKDVINLLDVSHQTAAYSVHRLEKEEILSEITGRQKNKIFVAREILTIMQEGAFPADQS
jgi:Fic family protein